MTQTGTGMARAMRVMRRRVDSLWPSASGIVWWPEDVDFVPPPATDPPAAPAQILRIQPNRSFEDAYGVDGSTTTGRGSVSFVHGVQVRPGLIDAQEAGEIAIRAIASPSENDNAEDVWTSPGIEINPNVQPSGIPENLAQGFTWTQYVVPYQIAEGF